MNWRLNVVEGPDKGRVFPLHQDTSTLLGRGKHADSRLTDPAVSRVHCEVALVGNRVTVSDLDGQGGTRVAGKRISETTLKLGDSLHIGDTVLRLQGPDIHEQETTPPAPAEPPPAAAQQQAAAPLPAAKAPPASVAGLPRERMSELAGKKFSHFTLGPVLAKAASGLVFRASDFKNERDVALKVFWPEFSANEDEVHRFIRAMKTMMPYKHPHLVQLYWAGKTGSYCWVAMELVEGESLTQVIHRIGAANMLDWRHAYRVALHVGRALEYSHGNQIVHRNITPQNILVRAEDKLVKLGDLMLAKAQEGTLAQQITKPGELLGDVRYMPPERTVATTVPDHRSDIYSLGAVVYALLTGQPPCEGLSLADTIHKIRMEEPPRPKKFQMAIPELFEGIVMKMIEKRPEERYADAASLLHDLERVAKYQRLTL